MIRPTLATRATRVAAVAVIGVFTSSCGMFGNGGSDIFGGDSRELPLTGSSRVPAAEGTATVSTTDDGNTQIELEVKHLAPPADLEAGANTYVVWARDNDGADADPRNLGALQVNGDLEGALTTVTHMRSFELFITAEQSPSVMGPSGETLLQTDVLMGPVDRD